MFGNSKIDTHQNKHCVCLSLQPFCDRLWVHISAVSVVRRLISLLSMAMADVRAFSPEVQEFVEWASEYLLATGITEAELEGILEREFQRFQRQTADGGRPVQSLDELFRAWN